MTNLFSNQRVLLASLLVIAVGACAQTNTAIRVTDSKTDVTVTISQQVSLRQVLDELCLRSQLVCEGSEQADNLNVVPMSLKGTRQAVLDRLLEGSGLNYAFAPSVKGQGRLVIQRKSAVSAQAPPASWQQQYSTGVQPQESVRLEASSAAVVDEAPQPTFEPPAPSSFAASSASAINMPAHPAGIAPILAGIAGSPLTSNMPMDAANAEPAAFLPFPDSHGQPIPAVQVESQYLPFPDSKGRPIPTQPATGGSPFPVEAIRQAEGR